MDVASTQPRDRPRLHTPTADRNFWRDALTLGGSVTPRVLPNVLAFGLIAAAICGAATWAEEFGYKLKIEITPYEYAGAVLGLLLVLRTEAGYDRWWEARKLWGGIVNQSRNLAVSALAYGPADPGWRDRVVRWAAVFPHAALANLSRVPLGPAVEELVGRDEADRLSAAEHMPTHATRRMADLLWEALDRLGMDRFVFLQVDKERAQLIDHIGACERILKTPMPRVSAIKIRRFIALFLLTLPLAMLHRVEAVWLIPVFTMMLAYPLLSLDRIGIELQNPFAPHNLSRLPLEDIAATIEGNLMEALRADSGARVPPAPGSRSPETAPPDRAPGHLAHH